MNLTPEEKQKETFEKIRTAQEENRARLLAAKSNLPYLNLTFVPVDIEALNLIPKEKAKEANLAVINQEGNILRVAVLDPEIPKAKEILQELANKWHIKLFIVSGASLRKAWQQYPMPAQKKEITGEIAISNETVEGFKKELTSFQIFKEIISKVVKTSTVQIVEAILGGSIALLVSDVHFEPEKEDIRLRFRMDGILEDVISFPSGIYNAILDRIKLLSGLKLNIHDQAQDGRFTIKSEEEIIEIRTSVLPGPFGENIVLRVLNPTMINLVLSDLGFREDTLEILTKELAKPTGMILTTGPTGSGKSTTLYGFIQQILTPEIKIITIEDPIEYKIHGITQTQVNPEEGYGFANGLRSIVRQDPDVILVGEIRDLETAEIAMHAALTGHLVFSTLHTNDAIGVVPRLIDLGVKPVIIAPALNIAMAQRLVRRVCQQCALKRKVNQAELEIFKKMLASLPQKIKLPQAISPEIMIYEAKGCEACRNGYKGRVAVAEIAQVDDEMERLINISPNESEIKDLALKKGMVTMQQDALIKILQGITTFEESEKVLGSFNGS